MGEVLPFPTIARVQPVIRIHLNGTSFIVCVKPCPDGFPSMQCHATYDEALQNAFDMQDMFGWEIDTGDGSGGDAA
jgi:hypothetical protein